MMIVVMARVSSAAALGDHPKARSVRRSCGRRRPPERARSDRADDHRTTRSMAARVGGRAGCRDHRFMRPRIAIDRHGGEAWRGVSVRPGPREKSVKAGADVFLGGIHTDQRALILRLLKAAAAIAPPSTDHVGHAATIVDCDRCSTSWVMKDAEVCARLAWSAPTRRKMRSGPHELQRGCRSHSRSGMPSTSGTDRSADPGSLARIPASARQTGFTNGLTTAR